MEGSLVKKRGRAHSKYKIKSIQTDEGYALQEKVEHRKWSSTVLLEQCRFPTHVHTSFIL